MSELKHGLHIDRDDQEGLRPDNSLDVADRRGEKKLPRLRSTKKKRRKRRKRRLNLAVLPTMLTLGNAVCGLAAIAVAMSETWPDATKLTAAGFLIFAGMLFDALDGSAARMTGQESKFGAQLDSLCDAITFGTAPAAIVWRICEGQTFTHQKISWAIGVLFALCVLIRLARFNVETTEDDRHEGFEGLPSPAAAGTIAAFAIAMPHLSEYASDPFYAVSIQRLAQFLIGGSPYFIPALAIALAYLMVSRFQYPHVFQQWLGGKRPPHQIGQALFIVLGAFLLHWLALPIAFCCYAFASPVRTMINRWRRRQRESAAG